MGIDLKSRCGAQQKDQILSEKKGISFSVELVENFTRDMATKKKRKLG